MMTQLSNKTVVKSQALQIGHLPLSYDSFPVIALRPVCGFPVTYEYNMF